MEPIEKEIWKVWNEVKAANPMVHSLSFIVTEYQRGDTELWGFIHADKKCLQWKKIADLSKIINEM